MTSGYDGSILNGLQAVGPWLTHFDNPQVVFIITCASFWFSWLMWISPLTGSDPGYNLSSLWSRSCHRNALRQLYQRQARKEALHHTGFSHHGNWCSNPGKVFLGQRCQRSTARTEYVLTSLVVDLRKRHRHVPCFALHSRTRYTFCHWRCFYAYCRAGLS